MTFIDSLTSGLGFSLAMGTLISVLQMINPRYELKRYPPDIKAKVEPQTKAEKRVLLALALLCLPVMLGALLADYALRVPHAPGFPLAFAHFSVVFLVWNTFDLLVMDWLIFCALTPRYLVIPGSEGAKEYKDYRFHARGFIIGMPISLGAAAVLGALAALLSI